MSMSIHPPFASQDTSRVTLRRTSTIFNLAALAIVAAIWALFVDSEGLPNKQGGREAASVASLLHGVSAGFLVAALILPALWGGTASVRYFACTMGPFLLVAMPLGMSGVTSGSAAVISSIVLCGLAIAVAKSEKTQAITIETNGIHHRRGFPFPKVISIPWDQVETVTTDLRVITTQSAFGKSEEHESLVEVRGNGNKIRLNTTRFSNSNQHVDTILERSRNSAINWTVKEIHSRGSVALGSLQLNRESLEPYRPPFRLVELPLRIVGAILLSPVFLFFLFVQALIGLIVGGLVVQLLQLVVPNTIAMSIGLVLGLALFLFLLVTSLLPGKRFNFVYRDMDPIRIESGAVVLRDAQEEQMLSAATIENALFLEDIVKLI